jgi:pSer/pThr/pTyr-binding forkhead associated (FHA) protein
MAFLTLGAERYELRVGSNVLGGAGSDAVALAGLTELEPAARITSDAKGTSVIERLALDALIRVDGEPLGEGTRPLHDGARVDVQRCALTFSDPGRAAGKATAAARREPAARTELVPAFSSPAASGRLVELATGRTFQLPMAGAVIGRDVTSDVVLTSTGVSRRHAVVKGGPDGFTITDQSANGTYVNGARSTAGQLLADGDLIQIGRDEFRFDAHAARPRVAATAQAATELHAALPPGGATDAAPAAPLLGSLHITRGALLGKAFPLDRPVCSIGRAEHNDVRVADSSVSASHATLLLKAGTWYVVDLRSANGTYVDGYRVGGERALHGPCTIRVGTVKMEFRPPAAGAVRVEDQRRRMGLLQRLASLW